MFSKLKFVGTSTTDKATVLKDTVVGMLSGTITQTAHLDDSLFVRVECEVVEGSLGACSWESIFSDTTRTLLRSPSNIVGKYNYLEVTANAPTNTTLVVKSGNAVVNDVLQNVIGAGEVIRLADFSGNSCQISASNKSLVLCNMSHNAGNLHDYHYVLAFVESTNQKYAAISEEGTMKELSIQSVLTGLSFFGFYVSNLYNPFANTHAAGASNVSNVFTHLQFDLNTFIPLSRDAVLDPAHMLIPFDACSLVTGWIGGNLSQTCGLYLTSSLLTTEEVKLTLDTTEFQVIRPYMSGTPNCTFLLKR